MTKREAPEEAEDKRPVNRRDFLKLSAFWACVSAWTLATVGLLKFPMPALLPDVSRLFKIGKEEDFPLGTEKILNEKKVILRRDEKGLSCVSMICTHLGCVVSKTSSGFKCPCHGSQFDAQGHVVKGPAPKPLEWLEISQLPNGKLVVDASKKVPVGSTFMMNP